MEDIMKKRLEDSIGKIAKIILKSNHWKYEGKITNFDNKYLEILDFVSNSYKVVDVEDILTLEVKE